MSENFDQSFDFDSPQFFNRPNQFVEHQESEVYSEPRIRKISYQQVLNESEHAFINVKRKYQQRFLIDHGIIDLQYQQDNQCLNKQKEFSSTKGSSSQSIIKSQKQELKKIQQQNRFLKIKIDHLTFRLKQAQIELNKLKYNGYNNSVNFQSIKQTYLKQLDQIVNIRHGGRKQTCEVVQKLRTMTDFDGKQKINLLNYFMSQVLQNIINDSTFYFIDSIMSKKGIWRNKQLKKSRKVDQEFIQAMGLIEPQIQEKFAKDLENYLSHPAIKYKQNWKNFHKSYIGLLNQGFTLQNFLKHAYNKIFEYIPKQNCAKVLLLFERIRLRKDIRELRQSWFRQIQYEQQNPKQEGDANQTKKTKF